MKIQFLKLVLQSATGCYYKLRKVIRSLTDFYYKVRQILQSLTITTK